MASLIIGMTAGILCTISFLPQVIKIFKTKRSNDLSLVTFSLFPLGVSLWLVYGILMREAPIIVANALTLALCILIVIMKLKYR